MRLRPAIFAALCALPVLAQEDVFDFIPPGGKTLLEGVLAAAPDALGQLSAPRGAGEWMQAIADGVLPGAGDLDEWEQQTLADYLAYAAPVTAADDLPWDGRDMALARCQSCHIITVVVTQDRERQAWLGTMNRPSHVEVELTPEERDQLADYLVVNGGIPIDEVPPALRAGGASY